MVIVMVKVKVYEKINNPHCHRCHRHRLTPADMGAYLHRMPCHPGFCAH